MKITRVTLENYRGIRHVDLQAHPRLNVFAGINGTGKSSILQAIAHSLSLFTARLAETKSGMLTDNEIHNAENFVSISLECDEPHIRWTSVRTRTGKLAPCKSNLDELGQFVRQLKQQYTDTPDNTNFTVIAYYPTQRVGLDIPKRIKAQHEFTPLAAYAGNPKSGVDFRLFFEWFRQRQETENNERISLLEKRVITERNQYQDPYLQAVRDALVPFFPGFSNLTVQTTPMRLELSKGDETLSFQQLSDGEMALISLVADIAFRLSLANPHKDNPLDGHGIILIDEAELHLHPEWQKNLIPRLLEAFPNCQFFLSTHSPLVINRVKDGVVFALSRMGEQIQCEKTESAFGYLPDNVMSLFMGVQHDHLRPGHITELLASIYQAIDKNNFDEAEMRLKEAQELIPHDAELTRAAMLIRRKKILQRQ